MLPPTRPSLILGMLLATAVTSQSGAQPKNDLPDTVVVKQVIKADSSSPNLLRADGWLSWQAGFTRQGKWFVCDNGTDASAQRAAVQTVALDQQHPAAFLVQAWSKAEHVGGQEDSGYSIYLDLTYQDGSHDWGKTRSFPTGTHDWISRDVIVIPEKPIAKVHIYLMFRGHTGQAYFRDPRLQVVGAATSFDDVPVILQQKRNTGFQIRDVTENSDFVKLTTAALGLRLETSITTKAGVQWFDVHLRDFTGRDRTLTLVYSAAVPARQARWLHHPRETKSIVPGTTYENTSSFPVGSNGKLSRYPFGAVATNQQGIGLGIDMMANSTPNRLCWLSPLLDVMGTETNWNREGRWQPMSDAELLYRRALCKGKPFCFLMNTNFDQLPPRRVEDYMKRCLAYGMFPGFFSHNAADGQYFQQPKLYNRDRPLFQKYLPLCRTVAEAGWEPITLARSSNPSIHVERFGQRLLTLYNDHPEKQSAAIRLRGLDAKRCRELLQDRDLPIQQGVIRGTLSPYDVLLLELHD